MATKKLFTGKDSKAEEMAEAKALKSGKISPKQYKAGEKSEGEKNTKEISKNAAAIKSGKLSPAAYAKTESKGMANGGKVMKKKC
jgi:hypothetical protein